MSALTDVPEIGFWAHASTHADTTAVFDPDGSATSFGELLALANRIVHAGRAAGLGPGANIAVVSENRHEVLALFMAVSQTGWRLTPINWHLTAPEVAYILTDSGASVVVASARTAETAWAACNAAEVPQTARISLDAGPGGLAWKAWLGGASSDPPQDRRCGGTMTYTSGTTGRPKGIRRPLPDIAPEVVSTQQALFLSLFGITPGSAGVHLVVAPLYHTAVINFATNHLHLGHTVVLMDRWTPEGMLSRIQRYGVTNTHMVPTMFVRLLKLGDEAREAYDVSSLQHVIHGAAPCPVAIKEQMLEWWGDTIYEYYAASEGGGTLATPKEWRAHPGTVGKPWPISTIRILDDDREPVPTGTPGTVWIRMGEHTFEYHDAPEKTRDAWDAGFFTVGDAGYVDEDGFLYLCDRKADMIIRGGVNIYPAEVEAVLLAHPAVADAAVFGIPCDDMGEEVMAVIEPTDPDADRETLASEVLAACERALAKYKRPRTIDVRAQLPRDPNGKLYKRRLRDPYWAAAGGGPGGAR